MRDARSDGRGTRSDAPESIAVRKYPIRLDQFLKLSLAAATGGEAKALIAAGRVQVDGEVELRRGRQLRGGEVVAVSNVGNYAAVSDC